LLEFSLVSLTACSFRSWMKPGEQTVKLTGVCASSLIHPSCFSCS
jgi:hypothetical protein